jgi:DNA mismatch endonuclease (patch repair protein)
MVQLEPCGFFIFKHVPVDLHCHSGMKPYRLERIKVPKFEEAAGFYTTAQRSAIMSKIRGTNTKPELLLRKALWAKGYRYRIHPKNIPGKPDIVITKQRLAIFVDGEFWHGRDWPMQKEKIKSNRAFWIPKIERNMQRDEQVNQQLGALGWTVIRFWDQIVLQELDSCVLTIEAYAHTAIHLRDNYDDNDFVAAEDLSNFTR